MANSNAKLPATQVSTSQLRKNAPVHTGQVPAKFNRQEDLVPYGEASKAHCVVIGCGAVGRQVATLLATMGVQKLTLIDFDTVEEVNRAPQMFTLSALGHKKVDVVAADCIAIAKDSDTDDSKVTTQVCKYTQRFVLSDMDLLSDAYVFACVDSIETRGLIWDAAVKGGARWLFDCRVGGEAVDVLAAAVNDPVITAAGKVAYESTLFSKAEAFPDRCTARMTCGLAMVAAGTVTTWFAHALRGLSDRFRWLSLDLFGGESDNKGLPIIESSKNRKPRVVATATPELVKAGG